MSKLRYKEGGVWKSIAPSQKEFDDNKNAVAQQLADTVKNLYTVNVVDFGATPNSLLDQTPYIQAAVDHLISLGGGKLFFPDGEFRIIADETTTPYNPKRVNIRGYVTGEEIFENGVPVSDTRKVHFVENLHIVGSKNTVVYMTGMTEEYLYNQEDVQLGNVDIFVAFGFAYCKNCSISNITIKGDYKVRSKKFRYDGVNSQCRTKAISVIGCWDTVIDNVKALYIMGNFVHANTASRQLDGYWFPSRGTAVTNCFFDTCLENGVNMTTLAQGSRVENCTIRRTNGTGIEMPGIIKGNVVIDCHGGGIAPSYDAIVSDNYIEDTGSAFYLAGTSALAHGQHANFVFSGNIAKNIRGRFIHIAPGGGNATFTNNRFINSNLIDDVGNAYNIMVSMQGAPSSKIQNVNISDNYFEVNAAYANFVEYGVYASDVIDSSFIGNTINASKPLTSDIYISNVSNSKFKDNKLTKGITQSSTQNDRNIITGNTYPTSGYSATTDLVTSLLPNQGEWKLGDVLRKVPSIVPKGAQYNLDVGYECVSTNPLVWRKKIDAELGEWTNSTPTGGTWVRGRRAFLSAPIPGGNLGWACTISGTFGTLAGITGSINSGEATLTVNSLTGIAVGNFITIAGVSGTKRVSSIAGAVVTLDSVSNATVASASVSNSPPSFVSYGISDLQASIVWDPSSLVAGAGETSGNISLSYATVGDFLLLSAPYDLQGVTATAYMVSAGIARIRLQNGTGSTVDLASGTWKIKIIKA